MLFYVVIMTVTTTTNETFDELSMSQMVNGRFVNSFNPQYKSPSFGRAIIWKITSRSKSNLPRNRKELDDILPVIRHEKPEELHLTKPGIRYIWIGHASCYVQMNNFRFLLDPVFRYNCLFFVLLNYTE